MSTDNGKIKSFGTLSDGREVKAAKISNANGAAVTILNYGGTVQSLIVPDRNGQPVDVVLGYDTAAEYESADI